MKNKVYFQFSIISLFWNINTWLSQTTKLLCTSSSLLCFLVRELNANLLYKQQNFWHWSFQNSVTFTRVSCFSCFSHSQLHASSIQYYLWISESLLPWATDCVHFHPAIWTQYHQHWNSFFHYAFYVWLKIFDRWISNPSH